MWVLIVYAETVYCRFPSLLLMIWPEDCSNWDSLNLSLDPTVYRKSFLLAYLYVTDPLPYSPACNNLISVQLCVINTPSLSDAEISLWERRPTKSWCFLVFSTFSLWPSQVCPGDMEGCGEMAPDQGPKCRHWLGTFTISQRNPPREVL